MPWMSKQTILSVRLSEAERKIITAAAAAESAVLSKKLGAFFPELSISAFVRAAAVERAKERMGKTGKVSPRRPAA
jgi:hypothetical protein